MTDKRDFAVEINISNLPVEFAEVVKRAYQKNPDPKDVKELQRWIENTPGLWKVVFDFSELTQKAAIKKMVSDKVTQVCITANIAEIKQKFGYAESTELERLLIENIICTWLYFQWNDYQVKSYIGQGGVRFTEIEFWERRLSLSQTRYLRACETLARVRRLMSKNPLVQVNIAKDNGQQVNVAGDFVKQEKTSTIEP
jgi:hypothetical protein